MATPTPAEWGAAHAALWRTARRVFKAGGHLLATIGDKSNTNGKMVRCVTQHAVRERDGPAETLLTPPVNRTVVAASFCDELEESGFTDVSMYTLSHSLCFKSGEEYVSAVLDNPALESMAGHKETGSLRRSILDSAQLVVDGIDPLNDDAKAAVGKVTGSAENHPLWRKPFSFPAVGNVAVATKPFI